MPIKIKKIDENGIIFSKTRYKTVRDIFSSIY